MGILASQRLLLSVLLSYFPLALNVIHVTSLFGLIRPQLTSGYRHNHSRQHPACDGCHERRVALNLRHISAPLPWPDV
jgi:hypothetical protein